MPDAPCVSVAYWPLVKVNEVCPSDAVDPLNTLKVSGEVRPKTSEPAPSSSTVVMNPPVHPEAVLSGTTGVDAPD
jgi:hypothetical protein